MISINGTLFMQAIHFVIASLFIRSFLIKPVLAARQTDKALEDRLREQIAKHKQLIEHEHKNQRELWRTYGVRYAEKMGGVPTLPEPERLAISYMPQQVESKIIDETVQQIETVLALRLEVPRDLV